MKHTSKLALFMAAGMVSAGVQAADFEVGEDTVLTLGGEVVLNYIDTDENNGDSTTEFTDDGSIVVLGGERDLGNGYSAYIETEFEYNTLGEERDADGDGDPGDNFTRDASVFGFTGDFGEIQVGDSDNVFEDLISDAIDPFENASLEGVSLTDEDSMITYYSPDMQGFSYRLQTRVKDETDGDGDRSGNEVSLIGAAQYDFGNFALSAGYDDRGSVNATGGTPFESEDGVYGFAATANLSDNLEASLRYAQQSNKDGSDADASGAALVYNYGAGDLYGAVQDFSPASGDSRTQVAGGVNYGLADGLLIFAEYGNFDREVDTTISTDDAENEKLAVAGLILEY